MELEARCGRSRPSRDAARSRRPREELRISQPAVSKHIADVEREIGAKLVERRPRGGDLTPAGEFLANHVLRAQALLAQAARGVVEFRPAGHRLAGVAGVRRTGHVPRTGGRGGVPA